jgi:outer membrane biosynthesis protein TonB
VEEKKDEPPARVESKPKVEPFVPPIISTPGPIKAVEKPSTKTAPEPVKAKPFSPPTSIPTKPPTPAAAPSAPTPAPASAAVSVAKKTESTALPDSSRAYFCGDSSFFSLHWALQTIAREKLTGVLRAFWEHPSVDLLARDGRVIWKKDHAGTSAPIVAMGSPGLAPAVYRATSAPIPRKAMNAMKPTMMIALFRRLRRC